MTYTSGARAKSIRERCIRVVAIVITIKQGTSNSCDVETNEKHRASRHRSQRNVRRVMVLLHGTVPGPMVSYDISIDG